MKIILGDNQFFGVNHYDLQKGSLTKNNFLETSSIIDFIRKSHEIGLDGFMINSNKLGYEVVDNYKIAKDNDEIHYSIPYPHKYAAMVNEEGMLSVLKYFLQNTSLSNLIITLPKFILSRDINSLIPLILNLEVPRKIPKGSTIYIQNVLTDLILGVNRLDILEEFAKVVRRKGFKPGIITLNPLKIDKFIKNSTILNRNDLTLCFNINYSGFNVFPSKLEVENYIKKGHNYNLMGMSIFSSGGADIETSIKYIKSLELDYVVFGSSKLRNIENNYNLFKNSSFG